jgi:hypothetical protein
LAAAEEEHCTVAHEFALTADANDPKNFDLFNQTKQPVKKKVKRMKQGLLRFFPRKKKYPELSDQTSQVNPMVINSSEESGTKGDPIVIASSPNEEGTKDNPIVFDSPSDSSLSNKEQATINPLHFQLSNEHNQEYFDRCVAEGERMIENGEWHDSETDEHANCVNDEIATHASSSNQNQQSIGDFNLWILDSGATSCFTPSKNDLINPTKLEKIIRVRIADGTALQATHIGQANINFTSDNGQKCVLRLQRVLYVPNLHTRLFSIESFVSNGKYSATYLKNKVVLGFRKDVEITIKLPHIPAGSFISQEVGDLAMECAFTAQQVDDIHCAGGEESPAFQPVNWNQPNRDGKKKRMNAELGHSIMGHRSVNSLLHGSSSNVWDDITFVLNGDSWCDNCKIAVSNTQRSKKPMRFTTKPLEQIFIDLVPAPAIMNQVKECSSSDFIF